ncbi:2'-5' RNA ligase family protein [Streptosporangium sp. NPDC002524]|uniref:2'-5' RNA ligase family protein n=1 Tax=Streptosporangium sp. NPDC002524 TaxID=3154537 RepID=UPI00332F4C4B
MNEAYSEASPSAGKLDERFLTLRRLTNHWARPATPRAYYWYLEFENSPTLISMVKDCQKAISFPYYDLTPPSGLHLTLDRIAFEDDISPNQLRSIEAAAVRACEETAPFTVTIGHLGGTPGAIGFSASPTDTVRNLRDTLREATLSVYSNAPVKGAEFHSHVAIAYCNTDGVPANQVVAAVERMNALPSVDVTVRQTSLVVLERRPGAYVWQTVSRIALSGGS